MFFSETLAHLQRLKVMHPHNLIALETMAEAYETYRMHLATVQAQVSSPETPRGQPLAQP